MLNQYEIYNNYEKGVYLSIINKIDTEDINPYSDDVYDMMCILDKYLNVGEMLNEHVYVLALDSLDRMLGIHMLTIGSQKNINLDEIEKNIYIFLLLLGAKSFIFVHNHPYSIGIKKGNLDSSLDDIATTQKLKKAGEIIGIQLKGSYVITKEGYYNIETNEKLLFSFDDMDLENMEE